MQENYKLMCNYGWFLQLCTSILQNLQNFDSIQTNLKKSKESLARLGFVTVITGFQVSVPQWHPWQRNGYKGIATNYELNTSSVVESRDL